MYKFWIEYHNGDRVYKNFNTLKEGFDYIYGIGNTLIRNYGYAEI